MCDAQALACIAAGSKAHWLEMAAHWRKLATDDGVQGLIGQLMTKGA